MYGTGLDNMFTGLIAFCLVVGGIIGGLAFWLIPLVWDWIKPLIHQVTA